MTKKEKAIQQMLNIQIAMDSKYTQEMNLVEELKKDGYSCLKSISISDTSMSITTYNHSLYVSKWSQNIDEVLNPEPKHQCDTNQEMPKTNAEFQKMLNYLEKDKKQCRELYDMLAPIFIKDNYEYHLKLKKDLDNES